MAKVCAQSGKRAMTGNNVSHSQRKTKRKFKPNLHKVKVKIGGKVQRVYLSTKALRSGKFEKVL